MRKEVTLVNLGCPKNQVDGERMLGILENSGWDVIEKKGEVVIVNTCAFIQPAKEESVDCILDFIEKKKEGKIKTLLVSGCLSQRFNYELEEELDEVDAFVGISEIDRIGEILKGITYEKKYKRDFFGSNEIPLEIPFRKLLTPPHTAYLKLSDGCDNLCSYCAVPLIRGRQRSRKIEAIVNEARILANKGVVELHLIAQDLTRFGEDVYGESRVLDVIKEISKISGIRWIRLMYVHPAGVTRKLINEIANNEKVCKYLDIPIQHICDDILYSMNRRIREREIRELIVQLRKEIPDIVLRTSLIIGFPGETKKHFEKLLQFIREVKFERLGAFAYSREEGTRAANIGNMVGEKIKQERLFEVLSLQREISLKRNLSLIGKQIEVIVDEVGEKNSIGRTYGDALEIDGMVRIYGAKIKAGKFVQVRITKAEEYDLEGNIVKI